MFLDVTKADKLWLHHRAVRRRLIRYTVFRMHLYYSFARILKLLCLRLRSIFDIKAPQTYMYQGFMPLLYSVKKDI